MASFVKRKKHASSMAPMEVEDQLNELNPSISQASEKINSENDATQLKTMIERSSVKINGQNCMNLQQIQEIHGKIEEWLEKKCFSECSGCQTFCEMMRNYLEFLWNLHKQRSDRELKMEELQKIRKNQDPFETNIFSGLFVQQIPSLFKQYEDQIKENKFHIQQLLIRKELMEKNYEYYIERVKKETALTFICLNQEERVQEIQKMNEKIWEIIQNMNKYDKIPEKSGRNIEYSRKNNLSLIKKDKNILRKSQLFRKTQTFWTKNVIF